MLTPESLFSYMVGAQKSDATRFARRMGLLPSKPQHEGYNFYVFD